MDTQLKQKYQSPSKTPVNSKNLLCLKLVKLALFAVADSKSASRSSSRKKFAVLPDEKFRLTFIIINFHAQDEVCI